jgi:hypothetical protein
VSSKQLVEYAQRGRAMAARSLGDQRESAEPDAELISIVEGHLRCFKYVLNQVRVGDDRPLTPQRLCAAGWEQHPELKHEFRHPKHPLMQLQNSAFGTGDGADWHLVGYGRKLRSMGHLRKLIELLEL